MPMAGVGPGPGIRLDQPMDDRLHNRRPSDEANIILRKISGAGQHPPLAACNMGMSMPDRTSSLPPGMKGPLDGFPFVGAFDDQFRFSNTLGECLMG